MPISLSPSQQPVLLGATRTRSRFTRCGARRARGVQVDPLATATPWKIECTYRINTHSRMNHEATWTATLRSSNANRWQNVIATTAIIFKSCPLVFAHYNTPVKFVPTSRLPLSAPARVHGEVSRGDEGRGALKQILEESARRNKSPSESVDIPILRPTRKKKLTIAWPRICHTLFYICIQGLRMGAGIRRRPCFG